MKLNKMIDHTLLKQDATEVQIKTLCEEAITYDFASVCVNPYWVSLAAKLLQNSDVKVCTVIGFPLGATSSASKGSETEYAIADGAHEIDMVLNIGALKSGQFDIVENDIKTVVENAAGNIVKVIIETCLLTDEEKVRACQISKDAGAHFVKTSTGFSTGGATIEDVTLMKSVVGDALEVKASGGVRNIADAEAMIAAGATRIGTSNGVLIVNNQTAQSGY